MGELEFPRTKRILPLRKSLVRRLAEWHSGFYLLTHGSLLGRVTKSELAARYAGSILGLGWAILLPLMVLGLYTVTYTLIFRIQVADLSPFQYTMFIFAGLVPFLSLADALGQGLTSVVASRSLLTNTVFPIDLAPVKAVLLGQVVMAVGMFALVLCLGVTGQLQPTIILLPIVWFLQILALTGIVWILSLINVVLRDLQTVIGLLIMSLMIISPIAYGPENVPENLRVLLILNPFAWFVMAYQKILIFGMWPETLHWVALVGWSTLLFVGGGYFFSRAKKAMIDYV
ncbi:MAG: ABC transporter [Planctomycetes bacterium]|nr:ABC transporter [Planctomycetota bacterium]